ncbi:hypothetical protein B296_00028817 [Ensete ventricosum]|uniref:t-SNARE coiled-coil homology domain-containing protein n=1 Tax=Ensete ventricosum TaxID=4639 RepID=A0A426ZUP9_ENSVE|nr:hypothetical protein B296_00028817 [Ensete ventricosum]
MNQARWSKPDLCLKQPHVGCKCKLACKLLDHEKRDSKQDEREVGYSPRVDEMQSGALTGKRSHKEKLSTVETRLDVLEASFEELYQGQGMILGVESSQKEVESRIDKVEFLVNRLTKDTKDSV